MLNHIKSLARHSSVYTISTFVQRALGFVMLPIYTDPAYLASRSEYGDLTLVYTFTAFMTIIYLYGMDAAILRYFFLGKLNLEHLVKRPMLLFLPKINLPIFYQNNAKMLLLYLQHFLQKEHR